MVAFIVVNIFISIRARYPGHTVVPRSLKVGWYIIRICLMCTEGHDFDPTRCATLYNFVYLVEFQYKFSLKFSTKHSARLLQDERSLIFLISIYISTIYHNTRHNSPLAFRYFNYCNVMNFWLYWSNQMQWFLLWYCQQQFVKICCCWCTGPALKFARP